MTSEPHPHQLTAEECAANSDRAHLNQAKQAAREAYLAATRALKLLDGCTDPAWIDHARGARDHAQQLHAALVLETEW